MVDNARRVRPKEIIVEGESAGPLAGTEFEVAESCASFSEFFLIFDRDDRSVKWAVNVSPYLGDALKHNVGGVFQMGGE